ncbi:MAG TPA: shikimate dehydrogenase [Burkholderiales bacterium]|nr:shikimate dehydrogenase [Burkholderiales bacterium]
MSDLYAVIGNPIAHSKSPQIHAAFAQQTSQDIVYKRIFCDSDVFPETVRVFRAEGGKGLNITVPFKHEAFDLATSCSERAAQAGAVNTLSFGGDEIAGDNTDGAGLVRDITANLGRALRDKSILLLGAGGASFGVIGPLLGESPKALLIVNRTVSKAEALARRFAAQAAGCTIAIGSYAALAGNNFDVVINATSAGLSGSMPALPQNLFAPGALAYDMVYGKTTPFMQFAQAHGAAVADGLGMLVEQAAESFLVWRGVRPRTAPVIAALRSGH